MTELGIDICIKLNIVFKTNQLPNFFFNSGLLFTALCYLSFSHVLFCVLNTCICDKCFFKIKWLGFSPPESSHLCVFCHFKSVKNLSSNLQLVITLTNSTGMPLESVQLKYSIIACIIIPLGTVPYLNHQVAISSHYMSH